MRNQNDTHAPTHTHTSQPVIIYVHSLWQVNRKSRSINNIKIMLSFEAFSTCLCGIQFTDSLRWQLTRTNHEINSWTCELRQELIWFYYMWGKISFFLLLVLVLVWLRLPSHLPFVPRGCPPDMPSRQRDCDCSVHTESHMTYTSHKIRILGRFFPRALHRPLSFVASERIFLIRWASSSCATLDEWVSPTELLSDP